MTKESYNNLILRANSFGKYIDYFKKIIINTAKIQSTLNRNLNISKVHKYYALVSQKIDNVSLVEFIKNENLLEKLFYKIINNDFEDSVERFQVGAKFEKALEILTTENGQLNFRLNHLSEHEKMFINKEYLNLLLKTRPYKFYRSFAEKIVEKLNDSFEGNTFFNVDMIRVYLSFVHEGLSIKQISIELGIKETSVEKRLTSLKTLGFIYKDNLQYFLSEISIQNIVKKEK